MKKLLVSAAVIALFSGAASAADLPVYEPPPVVAPVPVFSWTGFYAGLQGGFAFGKAEVNVGAISDEEFDVDGFMAGGFAGYNWQFANPVVVGIEGDIEWAGIDGDQDTPDVSAEVNWQGSFRGRLGYAFDRILPYVTSGFSFAGLEASSAAFGKQEGTEWGWNAGAGVDFAVTDHFFLRGEYRFSDLSDFDNDDDLGEVQDMRTHSFRAGAGYKF